MLQPSPRSSDVSGLLDTIIETSAKTVEIAGVAAIVLGAALSALLFARHIITNGGFNVAYHHFRGNLGRAILLGLELLVAADIIVSVTLELSLERLTALGVIVLIRTFLSFSLEVEIDGHWPWQDGRHRAEPRENKL